MTDLAGPLAVLGWVAALGSATVAAVLRASAGRRMALVAEAAHELRGSVGAAVLGIEGMAAGGPGAGRIAAVELALRRAGLALADLDAAPRGERIPQRAEVVDAGALLGEAVAEARPLARTLGREVRLDAPGSRLLVSGDPLRLAQAVANLLVNALEHGSGPVRVRALATADRIEIEVRDRGPGMPAAALDVTARRRTGRHGHGLAVAARVAAAHGGRLLVRPVAIGACAVLELPRSGTGGSGARPLTDRGDEPAAPARHAVSPRRDPRAHRPAGRAAP